MPPPSSVPSRSVCRDDANRVALRSRRDRLDELSQAARRQIDGTLPYVGIDVGYRAHRVGIAHPDGTILDEFDIPHDQTGFGEFFRRIEGYRLFNVNNLKLARFKEVFPGAAKTDPIGTRKILELFCLKDQHPLAKDAVQKACFSAEVEYVGSMIIEDAKRILELHEQIHVTCQVTPTFTTLADA